jgi:hypothetical protein
MRTSKKMTGWMIPAAMVACTGCVMPEGVQVGNSAVQIEASPSPFPSNAVCNPLDGGQAATSPRNGLIGSLFTAPEGEHSWTHAKTYQEHGTKLDAILYFNQLNVPTRPFDQGFVTQNGTILKTPRGDTLYEWFGLHFESVIQLSNHEQPGRYQFALMADDGAILSVNDDGHGFRTLVDNDLFHAAKLGCANEGIEMDALSRLPIQVDYFQGPRYHIALMLLWRKVPDTNQCFTDTACGVEGISAFFDSTHTPSVPSQRWVDMLTRGWNVVAPQNFLLPASAGTNPCVNIPAPSPTPTPTPTIPVS